MRALKIAITATLSVGLFLLMAMPWVLTLKPDAGVPAKERATFALMLTSYAGLLLVIFFVVIVLAWRIIVKQREEFREASLRNLQELIDGTLSDHGRQKS